jgi:glycosyltransferase involved in cell wall biosynthesis
MINDPEVSVIIPARNEEANLGKCLDSLVGQTNVSFEIIVVDDFSEDRTRAIAESYSQVQVLSARPLCPGWTGKANAIQTAIPLARGNWLLFTDADTIHVVGSLHRSLSEAKTNDISLLSYSPKQDAYTFWEKAIQPVVFSELNLHFAYEDVNNPASQTAAANGQYMLIKRSAYEQIGEHAAVKSSLLDDVDLARAIKRIGRLRFRYAPDAVSARMYMSLDELVRGWTKNLAALFPGTLGLAIVRLLESLVLLWGPLVALGLLSLKRQLFWPGSLLVITVLSYVGFARRLRRAGWRLCNTPSSLIGLPLFAFLLFRSYFIYKWRKNVVWKGRFYQTQAGP